MLAILTLGQVGWGVFFASLWALPLIATILCVLFLTPYAEEPWLGEKYGRAYKVYCKNTPRFMPQLFKLF